MSPILLDACEQQISENRNLPAPLGHILDVRYRGIQEMPSDIRAEAYRVEFERGTMMWIAIAR